LTTARTPFLITTTVLRRITEGRRMSGVRQAPFPRALRCALAVAAAVTAFSILPASSDAWTSNFWRSPTRNIACRYYPNLEVVTCQTDNDQFAVAVDRYGGKAYRTSFRWIPSYAPVLAYGLHWTAPGFNCLSRSDGMLCRTPRGHGFFLSRATVEAW
jgi:hypothetical protein